MTLLFEYPEKATFGSVRPKNKIYKHANPTAAVKELFVRQVDQIVWKYKLAPETINLQPTKSAPKWVLNGYGARISQPTGYLTPPREPSCRWL